MRSPPPPFFLQQNAHELEAVEAVEITKGKTAYFDKKMTDCLKGTALIFMYIHHLFTFPQWYIEEISYPELENFARIYCMPFKICVCIFAFLTGYTYFFQKEKTLKYSFKKILLFMSAYWTVYAGMLALYVLFGKECPSIKTIVYELFALKRPVMVFCWYVSFYCMAMLALPILSTLMDGGKIKDICIGIIAPIILSNGLMPFVQVRSQSIGECLQSFCGWFPCVAIGLIVAKHSVFEEDFDKALNYMKSNSIKVGICLIMIVASFLGRYCMPSMSFGTISTAKGAQNLSISFDVLYTPIFIYALVNLLHQVKRFKTFFVAKELLQKIGQKSMLMWFLHCVVLNQCKDIFQRIIYFPKNPIFVLIWALVFFYAMACIVDYPLRKVTAFEKRCLSNI